MHYKQLAFMTRVFAERNDLGSDTPFEKWGMIGGAIKKLITEGLE